LSQNKRHLNDTDARWLKKKGQKYYGYKNLIGIDIKHKLIRAYEVTPSTHDIHVSEELLDESNNSRDVLTDSAYHSDKKLDELAKARFREYLQRKGCRHKKLTDRGKKGNHRRSKIRNHVEHIFGVHAKRAGNFLPRATGLILAKAKIGLRNLAYNIDRYSLLMQT